MLGNVYMHNRSEPTLVEVMACGLYDTTPLPEPMLTLSIRPLGTDFSEILIKSQAFSFKKMQLKMLPAKRQPFC